MACIRKRRGKWVVDYRDATDTRRWITCVTRREAETALAEAVRQSRQACRPVVEPDIKLDEYAQRWLGMIAASVKERTLTHYAEVLRLHVLPAFGKVRVRQIQRGRIKGFLADKLASGLSRERVRQIHAAFRALLNAAIEDGVILANPSVRLGRTLRLVTPKTSRQERIKAFDRDQLDRFLKKAHELEPGSYSLFLTLARTGMRIGEAVALQWDDINFDTREIRVERAISAGKLSTPKSGHGRTIDMSRELAAQLERLDLASKSDKLRRGLSERSPWVFASQAGTPVDPSKVAKAFRRVLAATGLRSLTLHGFRHSFASLLLQQGESPAYVQRQLGHASIQLTVDTYGRWLPFGNKAAVDRLDTPIGSKMVATAAATSQLDDVNA